VSPVGTWESPLYGGAASPGASVSLYEYMDSLCIAIASSFLKQKLDCGNTLVFVQAYQYEKAQPGHRLQLDVKFLERIAGTFAFRCCSSTLMSRWACSDEDVARPRCLATWKLWE
jgi:hypothetical protein